MMKLTPWQKIYRAVKRGTSLRLSKSEVQQLRMDDALMTRGHCDEIKIDNYEDGNSTQDAPNAAKKRKVKRKVKCKAVFRLETANMNQAWYKCRICHKQIWPGAPVYISPKYSFYHKDCFEARRDFERKNN